MAGALAAAYNRYKVQYSNKVIKVKLASSIKSEILNLKKHKMKQVVALVGQEEKKQDLDLL